MFIYYIFYKGWELISFGLTKMNYRAAFTFALFTALNLYALLRFSGINIQIENVKMVKLGMTLNQIHTIMGNTRLFKNTWGQNSVYTYEAGLFTSSNIEIIFNDSMLVRNIIVPD
jgi:outer membrane protein assembly factor BamE (lipoprotein component of BamABCDE complex)